MTDFNNINPFSYRRWEDDRDHLFWLPPLFFEEMQENSCVYLTGSRGTGKTTLLKALDYNEQLNSELLQKQLGINDHNDFFKKGYIGLYFSTMDYIAKSIFSNEEVELNYGILFSHYIEYLSIFHLINAIQKLMIKKHINYSPDKEQEIISELLKERSEIRLFLDGESGEKEIFLDDISRSIRNLYEAIWNSFYQEESEPLSRGNWNPLEIPIGSILNNSVKILMKLCDSNSKKWILKICFDSFESFNDIQIKAINSLVATKNEYLSFVIASSREYIDFKSTLILHHPLTDDDRRIISLYRYYSKDNGNIFRRLVNEVTKLRFERHFHLTDVEFNLDFVLGKYSINELLEHEFEKTINPDYINYDKYVKNEFLPKWKSFLEYRSLNESSINKFMPNFIESSNSEIISGIPYTHAYLTELLNINLSDYQEKKVEIDSLLKKIYYKGIVGSMLCLCKDKKFGSNLSVPYAGSNMVIQMSDFSVRDFLRQMDEIYKNSPNKGEYFLNSMVPLDIQEGAILSASEQKYRDIDNALYYKNELKNLINFFGKYTAKIQSCGKKALQPPERGIIILDYSNSKNQFLYEKIQDIIELASNENYYICIVSREYFSDSKRIKKDEIRLHRLFAPKYKFSYRGASYGLEFPPDKLLDICNSKDENDLKKKIKIFTERYCDEHKNLTNWGI